MTTLPQTTGAPARLARVGGGSPSNALARGGGGNGALGPVGGYGPGAAGGANVTGLNMGDIVRVLRTNAWLIVLLTALALAVGYAVNKYLQREHAQYTSRATLQVVTPRIIDPHGGSGGAGSIRYTSDASLEVRKLTQAQLLGRQYVWDRVFQNRNGETLKTDWYKSFLDAKGTFDSKKALDDAAQRLGVSPITDTELINVTFRTANDQDAPKILQELVETHRTIELEKNSQDLNQQVTSLEFFQRQYKGSVDRFDEQIRALNAKLGATGTASGIQSQIMLLSSEVGALIQRKLSNKTDLEMAEGQLGSMQQQLQAQQTPASVQMMLDQDQTIARYRYEVDQLEDAIAESKATFGPESRQAAAIQNQLDIKREKLARKEEETSLTITTAMIEKLQGEVGGLKSEDEKTTQQIDQLKASIGEMSREYADYENLKGQREYWSKRLDDVDVRLGTVRGATSTNEASSSGSGVVWASRPQSRAPLSFPKLKYTMAVAGVAGLGLALGIAFLRELTDTRVRSPRDLARVGQLNLLGTVPHASEDPELAAEDQQGLALAISRAPHSVLAENVRQVRTRLQHAASLDTTRSIVVTSASAQDGKTVVACNLAAGLALNGRRILLVDANFKRPELHKIFEVANDQGFAEALSGSASIDGLAHKTDVPNLDVMAAGPRPANPTELLESQLLTDFIDRALEEYDHVVFDTGPLLLVSETSALAPRVDGVITVARARANSRGVLQRMRDVLRGLKAEHLGVVLNGVRTHGGGYYRRNIKNYYAYQQVEGK